MGRSINNRFLQRLGEGRGPPQILLIKIVHKMSNFKAILSLGVTTDGSIEWLS